MAIAPSLPSATYTARPSGLTPIPRGRLPTGTVATTRSVAASMMVTSSDRSLDTYTSGAASAAEAKIRANATATRMRVSIPRPPSRWDSTSAVPCRRSDAVEVANGDAAEETARSPHVGAACGGATSHHVQGLAKLLVPSPERERKPLVAVERWCGFDEGQHTGRIARIAAHHGLPDELYGRPGIPRYLRHQRAEATTEPTVQLATAELFEVGMPAHDPRADECGRCKGGGAGPSDTGEIRRAMGGSIARHSLVQGSAVQGHERDLRRLVRCEQRDTVARGCHARSCRDLAGARRLVRHERPARHPSGPQPHRERIHVHADARRHVQRATSAALVAEPIIDRGDVQKDGRLPRRRVAQRVGHVRAGPANEGDDTGAAYEYRCATRSLGSIRAHLRFDT